MKDRFSSIEGKTLDSRYKIIEKIGVGGMADVYRGEDLLLERPVAIKILHPEFADDEGFVVRFKREAQAAGKLSHPHIVNMYDVGFDQGYNYIIMEYVPGETLKKYITDRGKLSIEESVSFAIAIGEGLAHAHAMGIVHCDIKPHNIIITPNGTLKVTDFGIARAMNATHTVMYSTSVMGSAHYLSPEQASGKSVDGSTDIYSLGVVLYEMLTGRVPFEGDSAISVALKHVQEKLVPPSRYNNAIPPMLEAAVMKALEKDPTKRFASIGEMISDLNLSLGFASNRSMRLARHDFATQVLAPQQNKNSTTSLQSAQLENRKVKKDEGRGGFLDTINRIPQRLIVISAVALFIIAFFWAFLSYGNFWSNATVTVPNVVGKQAKVAQNILEDNHLRVSINEVTNSEVPAGKVISMTPSAGTEVKEQRLIQLVVSKGAGEVSVPDLKGMTIDQVRSTLSGLGISIGNISNRNDSSQPPSVVLDQSPAAFSKITKGGTVSLVINQGDQTKSLSTPKVIGMKISDAKTLLNDLKLSLSPTGGDTGNDAVITSQTPQPGASITEGGTVEVSGKLDTDKSATTNSSDSSKTVSGNVDITVPAGDKNQSVRIVVVDDNGRRVVYDHTQNPGDHVVKTVSGVGTVRIQVYINGALVQDQML